MQMRRIHGSCRELAIQFDYFIKDNAQSLRVKLDLVPVETSFCFLFVSVELTMNVAESNITIFSIRSMKTE